jgi:hypothetical protein
VSKLYDTGLDDAAWAVVELEFPGSFAVDARVPPTFAPSSTRSSTCSAPAAFHVAKAALPEMRCRGVGHVRPLRHYLWHETIAKGDAPSCSV